MVATENVRAALPGLIDELGVKTMLDLPCGDSYWIVNCLPTDIKYIGGDVVPEIITRNQAINTQLGDFHVLDLVSDVLPPADLLLVRDCLIHLPNSMVQRALINIRRAEISYLLTTTYPEIVENVEIEIGGFRKLNLEHAPFNLPKPICLIGENESGKAMGLWHNSALETIAL